ncbi:hypothetical protein [Thiohalophilus sp.]|uniref:hypothetical protein n=1 Tax=Thiohalophilus sp. TaxID=3028392 RepID=UPI002ACD690E|nr:hypothetical protein [Thiohalophilus sp.]
MSYVSFFDFGYGVHLSENNFIVGNEKRDADHRFTQGSGKAGELHKRVEGPPDSRLP